MLCPPEQSPGGLQVIHCCIYGCATINWMQLYAIGLQNIFHSRHAMFFLLCYQEGDKIKARILSADISQQVLEVCEGALTL